MVSKFQSFSLNIQNTEIHSCNLSELVKLFISLENDSQKDKKQNLYEKNI